MRPVGRGSVRAVPRDVTGGLRRSSHRATGGKTEKVLAKTLGEAELSSGGGYDGA